MILSCGAEAAAIAFHPTQNLSPEEISPAKCALAPEGCSLTPSIAVHQFRRLHVDGVSESKLLRLKFPAFSHCSHRNDRFGLSRWSRSNFQIVQFLGVPLRECAFPFQFCIPL
jgi:hypothetical protein